MNGTPDSASAAEAPSNAGMSASISGFSETTVRDHPDLVEEVLGEQRADRAVDQARGQCFFFGRLAFTLEEAAGDATGSVGLLDVVDRQREEILVRIGLLAAHRGDQHHGVAHRYHHGAVGLAGHLSGFQRDLMLTEGEGFLMALTMVPTDIWMAQQLIAQHEGANWPRPEVVLKTGGCERNT